MDTAIQKATTNHANEVAIMVGKLLHEIMNAIGIQSFHFDLDETTARLADFIKHEKYFVFIGRYRI
ncbi:MAG: hypothetical protein Q7U64_02950 [Desulfocapsaceae bacterium]|nr:hypothetical protein [Desulfocapsaceae bacterium]